LINEKALYTISYMSTGGLIWGVRNAICMALVAYILNNP